MKMAYFWIIFLVLVGVAISLFLIPSQEDVALINLKSQKFLEAEKYYLNQYKKGVRAPTIVYQLSVLYEKQGDLDKAIHIIKEYADEHPEDAEVLKRLAELYYLNDQYEEYGQTLSKLYQLKTSLETDTLHELYDYYKNRHDIKNQKILLNKIIASGKGDEGDYAELAILYAQDKKYAEASSLLKIRRNYFSDKITLDMILYEFWIDSHLDKERQIEVLGVVADYVNKKNDPKITQYVLGLFKERYPNLTLPLVKLIRPSIDHNLDLETMELSILRDHPEEHEEFYQKLGKLEKYASTNQQLQNFLFDFYLDREDEDQLIKLIRTTPIQKLTERTIINLAIIATTEDKPLLAKELQIALGPKYLEEHPLESLALEIGSQEKDARNKLNVYIKTHDLTRTDRFFLFSLASAAKFDKETLELGKGLSPYAGMRAEDLLEIAQAYAQMKKADVLYPIIVSSLPTIGEKNAEPALVLLDIALHHTKEAADWIQKQQSIKEDTLKALFETAQDNKEYPLSFYIAERLEKNYPSLFAQSSYALALVQVGLIDSIATLKQLYIEHPSNAKVQRDYLAALMIAVKKDRHYSEDLIAYMKEKERQGHLSKGLLREFGYAYLDTLQDLHKANRIFFILANESPQNRDDLETLIYLWGPQVSEENGLWIEQQADRSSDSDLPYWLETLNFIGRFRKTIQLFQKRVNSFTPVKAYFAYMQALSEEKFNDELKKAIEIVLPKIKNRKKLEELSTYAELAEFNEARVWIWQKIVNAYPWDPLAWQGLGRALYDIRAICTARTALEMFFYLNEGFNSKLYESLYEYAEIMKKLRHFNLSKSYYTFALYHIVEAKEQTPYMKEIAAQIYYQLSMYYTGLREMRDYFEMSGRDSDSTAAFANMLMDNGCLGEAHNLLNCIFRAKEYP